MTISSSIYNMGTVAVTASSASVVGTGTGWLVNAVAGGMFCVGSVSIPIYSVEDDTHLTLGYEWPAAAPDGTGLAYAIGTANALAADATYVHNALVNVLRTLSISAVEPDGAGTLTQRDAITPVPAEKYIWLHVETGYPLELYIRSGVSTWLGPFPWRGEQGQPGLGAGGYGLPLGGAVDTALVKSGVGDGVSTWQTIANSVAGLTGAVTAAALKTALAITSYIQPLLAATTDAAAQGAIGIGTFSRSLLAATTDAAARTVLGAQASLGFTPVNNAGGTMTGPLQAPTRIAASGNGSTSSGTLVANIGSSNFTSQFAAMSCDWNVIPSNLRMVLQANAGGGSVGYITLAHTGAGTITGSWAVGGALSKASGTFLIDHPLDPYNRNLRHGFVEAPRYDLIYRGVATLVDGVATVDIDAASDMTAGTFAALTTNAVVTSLQNQDGFARLRPGAIIGGTFEIVCEDACNDNVSWLVIAERNDAFVKSDADHNCDADGRFIPEFDKEAA